VSGRTEGRAVGGMADTIRRRMVAPGAFLDSRLEPTWAAIARIDFRRRLRSLWQEGFESPRELDRLAADLEVSVGLVRRATSSRYFGAAWMTLEARSPRLRRRLVPVSSVQEQIAAARHFLATPDAKARIKNC
jgi:hypothetical protein